jgi:hypothetical protein
MSSTNNIIIKKTITVGSSQIVAFAKSVCLILTFGRHFVSKVYLILKISSNFSFFTPKMAYFKKTNFPLSELCSPNFVYLKTQFRTGCMKISFLTNSLKSSAKAEISLTPSSFHKFCQNNSLFIYRIS